MPQSHEHDPDSTGPFYVDWGKEGNMVSYCGTIDSAQWIKNGDAEADLTVVSSTTDGLICEVVISGGVAGKTYTLTCRAVFGSGKCTLDATIELVCKEQ
jgi:hypothetical protein